MLFTRHAEPNDWICYSADRHRAAVIAVRDADGLAAPARSLTVYETDESFLPARAIWRFDEPGLAVMNCQWAGDTLCFVTLRCPDGSPTDERELRRASATEARSGGYVIRVWRRGDDAAKPLAIHPGRYPGNYYAVGGAVLVLDPLDASEATDAMRPPAQRELHRFDLATGAESVVRVPRIPDLGRPWQRNDDNALPLGLTNDGKRLLILFPPSAWFVNWQLYSALVASLDLQTGELQKWTPDDLVHGIRSGDSGSRFGAPGTPLRLADRDAVIAVLPEPAVGPASAATYAIVEGPGRMGAAVRLMDADLLAAGLQAPRLVTWTPDGEGAIVADRQGLWLLSSPHAQPLRLARGASIFQVGEWLDATHLLVLASGPAPFMGESSTRGSYGWAVLSIQGAATGAAP